MTGVAFDEGVVYALRDVTDEQALERARSDFVATASHELRTPLAAVYGAARTLRRTDIEMPAEQRDRFLEIIVSETERLTAIVSQILLAGQLEEGRVDADHLRDRSARRSPRACSTRRACARRSEIELRLEQNGDSAVALADEDKLRQVLVNLLDNAIKYSPDGGEVVVELGSAHGLVTADRARPRARHPARRAGPDLREVLPARPRAHPRRRRQRPRPLHLARARLADGRQHRRCARSPARAPRSSVDLPAA